MMDQTNDDNLEVWLLRDENETTLEDEDLPQTFGRDVAKDVESVTRTTVESMATIWLQMGLSSTEMYERIKQIKDLHSTVDTNAIKQEKTSLEKLIQYNDSKLKEINVMQSDLTLQPFMTPNDRSLKQIGRILAYKYNELIALKKERLKQMNELETKRDKLLKNMNLKPIEWRTVTNIPSEEELMHLQTYVSDLTKERLKRFNKYQSFRKILEQLFTDLEREPKSEFEKHFLFECPENFILSDEHMKRLQSLHSELESCYQQNNDKRKQMEKRLESLWDKLDVEQSYRDIFYRNKNGCKPSVLTLLEEEIFKYEELKRQNIELFVKKVRKELNEWYDRCYISDEQKDRFRPLLESNEFSEELLDCHEKEVQRIQEYHEECEQMFVKLEEWHEMWDRFRELENKANDPNRFNNRGGALLAEEREKNQIKKKLPKLESILKKFSEERHKQRSQFFEVFGIPVKLYLENLKMEYQDMKENEKKERQRLKQMEINGQLKGKKVTPICGGGVVMRKTPVKRTFTPSSPIPTNGGSNSKVRRVGAPLTPSKVNNDINCQTITKRANKGCPVPRARARNLQNQMNQMADTPTIEGSVLSIDEDQFQAPLGDRDNANSTFISGSQRDRPTPSRYVTKRREPRAHALNRRMSRSCNDLTEAINTKLQIGANGRYMPSIRSTPNSPQPKNVYGCTPSRVPRIAVPQRKRPFLL